MIKRWLFVPVAVGLMLASAPVARAQTAPDAPFWEAARPLSAEQVLERARQTYAGFHSYRGRCAVTSYWVFVSDGEPTDYLSTAESLLDWERDGPMKIDVFDGLRKWTAERDPQEVSLVNTGIAALNRGPERRVFEDGEYVGKTQALIIVFQNQAHGVGTLVLTALENYELPHPFSAKGTVRLQTAEKLGTAPCYVVARRDEKTNTETTLWFEQETFLLRQMTVEQGDYAPEPTVINGKTYTQTHTLRSSQTYLFTTERAE